MRERQAYGVCSASTSNCFGNINGHIEERPGIITLLLSLIRATYKVMLTFHDDDDDDDDDNNNNNNNNNNNDRVDYSVIMPFASTAAFVSVALISTPNHS